MPMNKLLQRLAGGIAVLSMLAGCASSEVAVQTQGTLAKAEAMNQVAARPEQPADVSPVRVRSEVYMGANVVRNDRGQPLPAKWESQPIQIEKGMSMSFQEVAAAITQLTRIPVAISTGAGTKSAAASAGNSASSVAPARTPTMANGPVPAGFDVKAAEAALIAPVGQTQIAMPDAISGDLGVPGRMRANYTGKLAGFLDLVATNYNLAWEYTDGRIVFEKTIMRTFNVAALPVISKTSFDMSSGSDAGSSAGTGASGSGATSTGVSKQDASTKSELDVIKEVKDTLDSIVTDGTYRINQTAGQVVVIASPQTVRRASDYLKELNQQLSQQIVVNVKVYSVQISDGDDYQSSISGALAKQGLNYAQGGMIPVAASAASTATSGASWGIVRGGFTANGLQQALASRGDVSVVTSASLTTVNGIPVPLQVANTRGYLASVSQSQGNATTGSSAQTTLTPGSVTTGFNLHLLPQVRKDGSVLLQYGMNISSLVGGNNGFDEFSSGSGSNKATIQLPNVDQRNFIQQAILDNNATLVLTGFEQVSATAQTSGPLNSSLFMLGGSNVSNIKRQILVIAITPTVLDSSVAANPPQTWQR